MNHEHSVRDSGLKLWRDWSAMWNGQPSLARVLVAPRFALHLTSKVGIDPALMTSPEAVERWVADHRAKFRSLSYHTDHGPFVDTAAGVVAGPWYARATSDAGEQSFCGMDTLAFREGRVIECWTMATVVDAVGDWGRPLNSRVG